MSSTRNQDHGDRDEEDAQDRRRTASLAALAFVLFLVIVGLYLSQRLSQTAQLQDCVWSGRTNCAPLTPPQH